MGRALLWPDKIIAALPPGTLTRIAAALRPGETKTDFLRSAILPALSAREAGTTGASEPDTSTDPMASPVAAAGATEAGMPLAAPVPPSSPAVRKANPAVERERPPSRLERKRAERFAKVREIVLQRPVPMRCQREFCGIPARFICLETEEVYCSDHRHDAVEPRVFEAFEA